MYKSRSRSCSVKNKNKFLSSISTQLRCIYLNVFAFFFRLFHNLAKLFVYFLSFCEFNRKSLFIKMKIWFFSSFLACLILCVYTYFFGDFFFFSNIHSGSSVDVFIWFDFVWIFFEVSFVGNDGGYISKEKWTEILAWKDERKRDRDPCWLTTNAWFFPRLFQFNRLKCLRTTTARVLHHNHTFKYE